MAFQTISLKNLYKSNDKDSIQFLMESLSNFKCKYDSHDLEDFLQNKALEFEERNLIRTYLVCQDIVDNLHGYFSIGIKSLILDGVSTKYKRLIASTDRAKSASVFLIAHIGACKSSNLEKYELLKIAVSYLKHAQDIIGLRAVYLDCDKDNKKLIKYYESFGFAVISEDEQYKNLIMKL